MNCIARYSNCRYKSTIQTNNTPIKASSLQVSHFYMFRHRDENLTDYDRTKNIIQYNKLVTVSHFTRRISLLKQKLHKFKSIKL